MSTRRTLPPKRRNFTWKLKIGHQSVFLTCGLFDDGTLGEVFIDVARCGSALRDWVCDAARMFSVALQHGTPLELLVRMFLNGRSEPCGRVSGHSEITHCTSIMDAVVRVLQHEFTGGRDDGRGGSVDRRGGPAPENVFESGTQIHNDSEEDGEELRGSQGENPETPS